MTKYDIEDLIADVKRILLANLNTKIAAVEAEKIARGAPATGLLPVDQTIGPDGMPVGYFEQNWSDKNFNVSPAIFYGIEDAAATGVGPYTQETIKLFVEIVLVDSGQDNLGKLRIHRYTRAIKEVFEENFDKFGSSSKIKVETIRPLSFKLDLNTTEEVKVGGVQLTTALA